MIDYKKLLEVRTSDQEFTWLDRDVILYALAIGMGQDPMNEAELAFVLEQNLRVIPSFATVAAWNARPPVAAMGVNYLKLVHGEQGVYLHRPLPANGRVIASGRVTGAVDKGDKGAIIFTETSIRDAQDLQPIAVLTSTLFARDAGGFGGPVEGGPKLHQLPARVPDLEARYTTRPDQALLYRLTGDRNPLHADPELARQAGFERPILHGLCTYAIACRAVLQHYTDYQPERMQSHGARFSSPVYPGETIIVRLWRDDSVVSFEASSVERGVKVLTNGRAVLK
jgi:acyl dehydratase